MHHNAILNDKSDRSEPYAVQQLANLRQYGLNLVIGIAAKSVSWRCIGHQFEPRSTVLLDCLLQRRYPPCATVARRQRQEFRTDCPTLDGRRCHVPPCNSCAGAIFSCDYADRNRSQPAAFVDLGIARPRVTAPPEDMRGAHDISQKITTAAVTLGKFEPASSPAGRTLVRPLYLETAQGFVPQRRRMIVAPI